MKVKIVVRKIQALVHHTLLLPKLVHTWFSIQALSTQTRLFCFFPFYQTGGSEQVHADILQSLNSGITRDQLVIFFTKPSRSTTFKPFFYSIGQCLEVTALDRSKYRRILIRLISRAINRCPNPTVFGANATLLYEIVPHLRQSIKVVDLTHSFVPESDNPVERASLPCVSRLNHRVVISQAVRDDYEKLYLDQGIAQEPWLQRLEVIPNRLNYPRWDLNHKNYEAPPLKILFVGRNSAEKRIPLIGRIACELRDEPVQFTMVGPDLDQLVRREHRAYLHFEGEITDPVALSNFYKEHHVILIVSRREGFPLVLAEGMAHGAVPVATQVGGIAWHVSHQANGYLIENYQDEDRIVKEVATCMRHLLANPGMLSTLGKAAQDEAYRSFSPEMFAEKWNQLLLA